MSKSHIVTQIHIRPTHPLFPTCADLTCDDSPRLKAGGFSVHGGGVFSCRSPKAPSEPEKSWVSLPTPVAGCSAPH